MSLSREADILIILLLEMKYFICVFTIIEIYSTLITSVVSQDKINITPIDINLSIKPIKPTGCDCKKDKVPLYRLYNIKTGDHFYTTNLGEANNAVNSLGYIKEGTPGFVLPATADCLCYDQYVPVYRLFKNGVKKDHFYTTSAAEASTAAQTLQYQWEGIAYYCAAKPNCDCGPMKAFHRYYRNIDHFYTTSLDEGFANVIPYPGNKYEGILCYIWV